MKTIFTQLLIYSFLLLNNTYAKELIDTESHLKAVGIVTHLIEKFVGDKPVDDDISENEMRFLVENNIKSTKSFEKLLNENMKELEVIVDKIENKEKPTLSEVSLITKLEKLESLKKQTDKTKSKSFKLTSKAYFEAEKFLKSYEKTQNQIKGEKIANIKASKDFIDGITSSHHGELDSFLCTQVKKLDKVTDTYKVLNEHPQIAQNYFGPQNTNITDMASILKVFSTIPKDQLSSWDYLFFSEQFFLALNVKLSEIQAHAFIEKIKSGGLKEALTKEKLLPLKKYLFSSLSNVVKNISGMSQDPRGDIKSLLFGESDEDLEISNLNEFLQSFLSVRRMDNTKTVKKAKDLKAILLNYFENKGLLSYQKSKASDKNIVHQLDKMENIYYCQTRVDKVNKAMNNFDRTRSIQEMNHDLDFLEEIKERIRQINSKRL